MSASAVEEYRDVVSEAKRDKEAIVATLFRKSFDPAYAYSGRGEMLYTLAAILNKMRVAPGNAPILGVAEDGKTIHVGPKYRAFKKKYGPRVTMLAWMHEAMHVLYLHNVRMKFADDKTLYNILADLYVNEELRRIFGDLPSELVTLSTVLSFLEESLGTRLSEEERRLLNELAAKVVSREATVDQVYEVISRIKEASDMVKRMFANSMFYGRDVAPQGGGGEGGEAGGDGGVHGLERRIRELVERSREMLREVSGLRGAYRALAYGRGAGAADGPREAVSTLVVNELRTLSVNLEQELMAEIGSAAREYAATFSRFSEDAYWLPAEEPEPRPRVYVLLDSSPSVGMEFKRLFLHWVHSAARKYRLEMTTVVFAVGVLGVYNGPPDEIPEGSGTTWDYTVAETLRRAAREESIVVVLSDFAITVQPDALEALKEYKRRGGKLSCWTIGEGFGPLASYCDFKHRVPALYTLR